MDPQPEAHEADRDHPEHDERVADDRPAGERLHDVRYDPDRGDEHDVDVGMSEDPEKVLP